MLSAKKVKLHGMKSSKWTVYDKLTQYKGLIKLYTRDRKVIEFDTNVNRKKQIKILKKIQKELWEQRETLDNAIRGDRQKLRNCLQEHRHLQLAYQDLHPTKVIEHLHQVNFTKRKDLDKIKYEMKLKTDKLIALKLELAELEDLLMFSETYHKLPEERQAEIVTGKVQDSILKKEAANAVNHTYKSILDIMKNDAIYFDAVLEALKQDAINQGKCMFRTTELGQLATEYLDDRKDEFNQLEAAIKMDMKMREVDMEKVRGEAENLETKLKFLIRRDSDLTMCKMKLQPTNSMILIKNDYDKITDTLEKIVDFTMVSCIGDIYPCMQHQRESYEKLKDFAEKVSNNRDILLNKFFHFNKMYTTLFFTMADTTLDYKTKKKELLEEMENCENKRKVIEEKITLRGNLLVNIRKSLQLIFQICKNVNSDKDTKKKKHLMIGGVVEEDDLPKKDVFQDPNELVSLITEKLSFLLAHTPQEIKEEEQFEANMYFQNYVKLYTRTVNPLTKFIEESLIDVAFEDSYIPNRETIKLRSQEIVEENKVPDPDALVEVPKKKKFKFKKGKNF